MWPTRLTMTFAASAALGLALGVAVLAVPAPARAADDDVPLDTKIFRSIMQGLGLRRDGDNEITYGERAPLVIPPARTLPPPEKSEPAVANNPAWPKDPDVTRRNAAAEYERNRNIAEEMETERHPLRPDQMTPGAKMSAPARQTHSAVSSATPGARLTPSELGYKGNLFSNIFGGKNDEDVGKFTGEPPRATLTDPPRGYQTPSPDQPYGVTAEKAKPTDYYSEHGMPSR